MKARLVVFIGIIVLVVSVSQAAGETPTLRIYFDIELTQGHHGCPNPPDSLMEDSLYVVAENFGLWISAMEYQILYPPELIFLEDVTGGLDIGNSADGISTAWPTYLIGTNRVVINKVRFKWNCQTDPSVEIPIPIVAHPISGYIRGVAWWTQGFIYAVGSSGWISQEEVPIEDTSWGRIKSIYNN